MSENTEISPEEFFNSTLALIKRARMLAFVQKGFLVLCYTALITGLVVKFSGGPSAYVFSLGLVGALGGLGSVIVGHYAKPTHAKAQEVAKVVGHIMSNSEERKRESQTRQIPLTIGFANLSGDDLADIVSEDAAVLSPLFIRSTVVPNHQIPSAEILFVYAHLNEDGTIKGPTHSGIRQVVELTGASIVVLASPNPAASIQNAASLPGPKTANIVLTLDRNGNGFSRFFGELFEKMRSGKDMLSAWVEISPQHPSANPAYAPQTILMAEGGKVAFPR